MRGMIVLANGQIDIHRRAYLLANARRRVSEGSISQRNKELILNFLRDCELGRTVKNRAKKELGDSRLAKLANTLLNLAKWLEKDFDRAVKDDIDNLVLKLKNDEFRKPNGLPYTHDTKLDHKKILKKFYKWLLGNNRQFPELVEDIDTSEQEKNPDALTREQVELMIAAAGSVKLKALVMVLFDGGFRAEEFLNIKLKDVVKKDDYYMLRVNYSKTKPRTVSVRLCTELLSQYLQQHPYKDNPESQLFPLSYGALRMSIARLGMKALNRRVYPHLLRHSSATYYAQHLTHYQLCYRYGWSMASDMPDVYIRREGIEEEKVAGIIEADEVGKLKKENQSLQVEIINLQTKLEKLEGVVAGIAQNLQHPVAIPVGNTTVYTSHSGLTTDAGFKPFEQKKEKEKGAGTWVEL